MTAAARGAPGRGLGPVLTARVSGSRATRTKGTTSWWTKRPSGPKAGSSSGALNAVDCQNQIAYEKYLNGEFFGNHAALVSMTSVGGEIAALSGPVVNPYPKTKLGVIEVGATADILLVDGNPLEDLTVIGASEKWFDAPPREGVETIRLIMKDGVIYKNTIQ